MEHDPYAAPVFDHPTGPARVKLCTVDGELFLGLFVDGRRVALMEPAVVENELRHYRRARMELTH